MIKIFLKKLLIKIITKTNNFISKYQISPKANDLEFNNYKSLNPNSKWGEMSQSIFQESVLVKNNNSNFLFELRNDFLRKKPVSDALHPPQYSMGLSLINYLINSEFGNKLISSYSDSAFGKPYLLSPKLPTHSSLSLQHFCYLTLVKEKLKVDLLKMKNCLFIDYGHGYGNMSRILLTLNNYIDIHVLDLKKMLIIQECFHKNTLSKNDYSRIKYFVSDDYHSKDMGLSNYKFKHFNATFSLSETPFENRKIWINFINKNVDSFFITYQAEFDNMNNISWFEDSLKILEDNFLVKRGSLPSYKNNKWIGGTKITPNTKIN